MATLAATRIADWLTLRRSVISSDTEMNKHVVTTEEDIPLSRQRRRDWVVIKSITYLDGTIETREGRPLRPRLRTKTDYRATTAKGRVMCFASMTDAKRWISEAQTGGNPNGFLGEIAGRGYRQRRDR